MVRTFENLRLQKG